MAHRLPRLVAFALLAGLGHPSAAHGQWVPGGIPICVAPNTQSEPGVVSDGAGGALVYWIDVRNGGRDVYAQRVTADGLIAPGWPPNGVYLSGTAGDLFPLVGITDGAGGAILAWEDRRNIDSSLHEIYAQRITAEGTISPGWPAAGFPVCVLPGDQRKPQMIADGEGGAIITWRDGREDPRNFLFSPDIYALRVTADGAIAPGWTLNGTVICAAADGQWDPTLAADGSGGAIINWFDFRDGSATRSLIYAQRVHASGEIAAGWPVDGIPVCVETGDQVEQRTVEDGVGGAFVLWRDFRTDANFGDVYAQRITGAGTIAAGWPADGVPLSTAFGTQQDLSASPDGYGGALVAWEDYTTATASDIFAQRVTAQGTIAPGWPAQGLAVCSAPSFQLNPRLAPDGAGGAYLVWEDTRSGSTEDVYAQHVTGLGTVAPGWISDGHGISTELASQPKPAIASDGRGGAFVAWSDLRYGTKDIFAHRLALDGPVPTLPSLASTEVTSEQVVLLWSGHGATDLVALVERRTPTTDWETLGGAESVGGDLLRYEDRAIVPGAPYAYRLAYRDEGGGEHFTEETWVDVPALVLSLAGFRPNPALGTPTLVFSLPDDRPARLEVLDVKGRVVRSRDVGGLGGGKHVLPLARETALSPGMYWIRLIHPERTLTTKGLVVR